MPENIESRRLLLVPYSLNLARAEMAGSARLATALSATVDSAVEIPADWPPPLNDEESMNYYLDMLEEGGEEVTGWGLWFFLLKTSDGLVAAGNGGFKGLPGEDGIAEIGYSICLAQQRQGLATEAITALLRWAGRDACVKGFIAHTLTGLTPSIRVLEKCGFSGPFPCSGHGPEEGVIRYERNAIT